MKELIFIAIMIEYCSWKHTEKKLETETVNKQLWSYQRLSHRQNPGSNTIQTIREGGMNFPFKSFFLKKV